MVILIVIRRRVSLLRPVTGDTYEWIGFCWVHANLLIGYLQTQCVLNLLKLQSTEASDTELLSLLDVSLQIPMLSSFECLLMEFINNKERRFLIFYNQLR